jgi:acyl dehydratase
MSEQKTMADPGMPEKARSLIGQRQYEERSTFPIEMGYVYTACASVQNGNPLYWDPAVAQELTEGPVAPPTMLSTWFRPHYWQPGATGEQLALQAHFDLKALFDLPEAIIAGSETSFGEPVRPGDVLSTYQVVRSISEPKTTKVGSGRFWVIEVTTTNQRGEWVGTESYDCFGYRRPQA